MKSKKINISISHNLTNFSYDIEVGTKLIKNAGIILKKFIKNKKIVIIHDNFFCLNKKKNKVFFEFVKSIEANCNSVFLVSVQGTEKTKSIDQLNNIIENILSSEIDRESLIIAFGGGVVGDVAGFAAAIMLRGINFIQIPTTLLSQVDSSIGGKTGINSSVGKNLIGAFHQPLAVISDIDVLKSLPKREFNAGLAEVIKYGLIKDLVFIEWLEKEYEKVLCYEPYYLQHVILKSCEIKAKIVELDEKEQGQRALLNLGHTFAHAIEFFGNYDGKIIHGEAVAIGICLAFKLSHYLGFCSELDTIRTINLFKKYQLPNSLKDINNIPFSSTKMIERFKYDKKNKQNQLTFILNKGIGKSFILDNVNTSDLIQFLDQEL